MQVNNIERPLDILNGAKDNRVVVELKNNVRIVGKLKAFDIHINLVLEEAEEWERDEMRRKIGNVFVRGDMIVMVAVS